MIKWNGPGVLYHKGRKFKAGDIIPAGILSVDRLSEFAHNKKVKVDAPVELKPEIEVIQKRDRKSKAELEEEELQRMIDEEAGQ
jgi:hypothetical protein